MKQNRVQLREDDAGKAADNQPTEPMAVDTASVSLTGEVRGGLFDLDGVITKTAAAHAAAVEGDVRLLPTENCRP